MLKKILKVTLLFSIMFFLCIVCINNIYAKNSIVDFRESTNEKEARFVLEMSEKPQSNVFALQSPSRLVIDLKDADDKSKITNFQHSIVKSIRTSASGNGDLRIVLDLSESIKLKNTFVLSPSEASKNYRLVIDFSKTSNSPTGLASPKENTEKEVDANTNITNKNAQAAFKQGDSIGSLLEQMGFGDDVLGSLMEDRGIVDESETENEIMPMPSSIRNRSVVSSGSIFEPILTREEAKKNLEEDKKAMLLAQKKQQQEQYKTETTIAYNKNVTEESKNNTNRDYISYSNKTLSKKTRKPVIIIDAGHGGKDPGAIGVRGTKEKLITLLFAKTLKDKLEDTGKYKVYLTRSGDYFITLGGRVKKAQDLMADLFISFHADFSSNRKATGLSVYSLSENASDEKAEILAQKENKTDIIAGANFKGEYDETIKLLIDLSRRDTMNSSTEFAEIAIDELVKRVTLLENTHRYAGFAVLTAPDVPSILIELGFLSNKSDERMLKTSAYQNKVNYALENAINKYFRKKGFLNEEIK